MRKKHNNGFTLVEVLVAVVILAILIIGATFSFNMINKTNNIASRSEQAMQLSNSILEQIGIYKFSSITEETCDSLFVIPSYYDSSEMSVTYEDIDDNNKHMTLWDIKGNVSEFNVDIQMSADTYTEVNSEEFPIISYLNNANICVINPCVETAIFESDADGNYFFNEEDDKYNFSDVNSYDNMMLLEFKDRNYTYMYDLYLEECLLIEEWNANNEFQLEIPEFGVEPYALATDEELYSLIKREFKTTIEQQGHYIKVLSTMNYTLDEEEAINIIGEQSNTYSLEVMNTKYTEFGSLYMIYSDTKCVEDKVIIDNPNNLNMSLFFIVSNKYSMENLNSGLLESFITPPSNMTFEYTQTSGSDLVNFYTNCNGLETGIYIHNYNQLAYESSEPTARMYSVKISVYDSNGNNLYTDTVTSVLDK